MMIDAASERSEQGRFLRQSPGSSNAVLGTEARSIEGVVFLVNLKCDVCENVHICRADFSQASTGLLGMWLNQILELNADWRNRLLRPICFGLPRVELHLTA